jgi:UDP-2-acetamido-3-amino-2,3-dideoxy-glucuronate N-acetyltransferase
MEKNNHIHESAYIDEGAILGQGIQIWHFCHVMPGAVIGDRCKLGQNVMVASGVRLGSNVKVQNNVSIYEGVVCEDDVFLGPSMVFTNILNPRSAVSRKGQYISTLVKKGASIGANATIVCGGTIGRYALIGAGAVVRGDVPDYALMLGVPAVRKGWVSAYGHRLEFDANGRAECPESGEQYECVDGNVRKI